ncbi:MAG: hypothetical protein Q4A16_02260 [Lautropia sp.]|nr:hypothetical protein [Lautropia sp.]
MSYLKRFSVTGSVCPSSPFFGQRAAHEVTRLAPGYDQVVVAGIGSGVVASRIYRHHPDAILFEIEHEFATRFRQQHPSARVVADKIQALYEHHPELKYQRVLLASFIPTAGAFFSEEISSFFLSLCRSGGYVMQMRYLPHRMSARFFDGMRNSGVVSERLFTVARNLPPVSMFGMRSLLTSVDQDASPVLHADGALTRREREEAEPRVVGEAARIALASSI